MEDEMWAVSSSGSSRSHQSLSAPKYQSGSYRDKEDFEEEEEEEVEDDDDGIAEEYTCPFCSDYYFLIDLCHHIDEEHQLDANNGVCPVCGKRVKRHMVDHITTHHADVLKSEQMQASYNEDSYSSDKALLDDLPPSMNHHHSSKNVVSDQFLSFINNSQLPSQTKLVQTDSSVEDNDSIKDETAEKEGKSSTTVSDPELLEKTKKCEFVQELLLAAIFDDGCNFF